MSLREYIESRSIPVPFVGCWLWLRSFGSHGYGNACSGGRSTTAHRVSFEAFKGEIPDGMLVQHSCDNKWCVNPDHLSLGTDATNSADKFRKGRDNLAAREFPPHPSRRLTDVQVISIRLHRGTQREIANEFDIDLATVGRIRRFEIYKITSTGHQFLRPLNDEQIAEVDRLLGECG